MRPLPFSGQSAYTIVFWVTLALWIGPEILVSRRMQSGDRSRDRGSMVVVIGMCFFGMGLAIWLSNHELAAAISRGRRALFFSGIAVILAGVALRWYAIFTLGASFTFDVTVRAGQRVVETGPYRYIRHPSYTGALVSATGLGLALGNWASLAACPLCLLVAYGYRMHVEEAALLETLGAPYREYMRRTRRLVPFLY